MWIHPCIVIEMFLVFECGNINMNLIYGVSVRLYQEIGNDDFKNRSDLMRIKLDGWNQKNNIDK